MRNATTTEQEEWRLYYWVFKCVVQVSVSTTISCYEALIYSRTFFIYADNFYKGLT
jgi:hypothetical protein